MYGIVFGLGSVSVLSSKEGFINIVIRNFVWLLMMGIFLTSVPGCFGDKGVFSFGFWEETLFSFWVGGEEKESRVMEFELCFTYVTP